MSAERWCYGHLWAIPRPRLILHPWDDDLVAVGLDISNGNSDPVLSIGRSVHAPRLSHFLWEYQRLARPAIGRPAEMTRTRAAATALAACLAPPEPAAPTPQEQGEQKP